LLWWRFFMLMIFKLLMNKDKYLVYSKVLKFVCMANKDTRFFQQEFSGID
jgi:hypothetical protein